MVKKRSKAFRTRGAGNPSPRDIEPQEEMEGRPLTPPDAPVESSDDPDDDETPPLGIRITTPTPRS